MEKQLDDNELDERRRHTLRVTRSRTEEEKSKVPYYAAGITLFVGALCCITLLVPKLLDLAK